MAGSLDGLVLGRLDGCWLDFELGSLVGLEVGLLDGSSLTVGTALGLSDGSLLGEDDGRDDGSLGGRALGLLDGSLLGADDNRKYGGAVPMGAGVPMGGLLVGSLLGDMIAATMAHWMDVHWACWMAPCLAQMTTENKAAQCQWVLERELRSDCCLDSDSILGSRYRHFRKAR